MRLIPQKILLGIVIFTAVFFMLHQHAEGVIGDIGKPGPNFKQSLLQNVGKINQEIKIAEAKLNKANEGDDLFKLTLTKTSIPNLKNQINTLSQKIAKALKSRPNNKELVELSNHIKQSINILKSLEIKAKANMKAGSMKLLHQLSASALLLQNDINKLGPQPEPPDKGTQGGSSDVNKTKIKTPSNVLDVEKKMRYDRDVKETGSGIGSSAPVSPPGPTPSDPPPKAKDDPARRGDMIETDRTPGVSSSSPAPDGPVVGPGDPERDVRQQ